MIPRSVLDRRHLLASALVAVAVGGALLLSPAALLSAVRRLDGGVFLAALLVGYLVRPFVGVPLSPFSVLVGYRYGVGGVVVALAGTVLTCLPPYLAGGYLGGGDGPLGWLSRRGERAFSTAGGFRGVVAARLSPAPADAVSYGAGLSGVAPGTYALGTLVGEVPWAVAFVTIGSSLATVSLRGVSPTPELLAGTTLLAILLVAYPLYRSVATRFRE